MIGGNESRGVWRRSEKYPLPIKNERQDFIKSPKLYWQMSCRQYVNCELTLLCKFSHSVIISICILIYKTFFFCAAYLRFPALASGRRQIHDYFCRLLLSPTHSLAQTRIFC